MPPRTQDGSGIRSAEIPPRGGIGLRFAHQQQVLDSRPRLAWLEVHAENYLGMSAATAALESLRADYPLSVHAVGLSLGSADGLDHDHLQRLKRLIDRVQPALVSDHLSWSRIAGVCLPDLLPLPLTEEALAVVTRHVDQVQHALGRPILIENPSTYLQYRHSTIPEPEFLAQLTLATGCGILCDLNNIHVSCHNHGWDPSAYLAALPAQSVRELHVAGHATVWQETGALLVDEHGCAVPEPVWALYRDALRRFGRLPTLVERDNHLPPLADLLREALLADAIADDLEMEIACPTCATCS